MTQRVTVEPRTQVHSVYHHTPTCLRYISGRPSLHSADLASECSSACISSCLHYCIISAQAQPAPAHGGARVVAGGASAALPAPAYGGASAALPAPAHGGARAVQDNAVSSADNAGPVAGGLDAFERRREARIQMLTRWTNVKEDSRRMETRSPPGALSLIRLALV